MYFKNPNAKSNSDRIISIDCQILNTSYCFSHPFRRSNRVRLIVSMLYLMLCGVLVYRIKYRISTRVRTRYSVCIYYWYYRNFHIVVFTHL